MQIEVTTRHGSISSDVRDRLTTKAEKLLTFFERVTSIQITVDSDTPLVKRVDIRVNAEHKHDFIANAEAEDVLSAFDRAYHKMEQQVKKYKERVQDHRRDRPINELVSPELDDDGVESEPATEE